MIDAIPMRQMIPLSDVVIELDDGPHPFEVLRGAEIEENWLFEKAANPHLFDGRVTLVSSAGLSAPGILAARCHLVRYATLLHWIRHPEEGLADHVFAHAILESADRKFIAIRMGPRTVNAGKCYFAAGSVDAADIVDGRVDIDGNMRREVAEEVGLDLSEADAAAGYRLWRDDGYSVLMRRYRFDRTAENLCRAINDHVRQDPDPEIVGPVILEPGGTLPDGLARQMIPILDWLGREPSFTQA
ncbi:hypothetical protein CSC94_07430 [Zhengella mangrovi]|uniref:NUDIX hydrolase n=1 Tax=Zhengella mangrovi TaxID=1982044 RepID=A0A2G1QPX3_9HYPH|nr:hypothetical protein [Zhengella mangrovi]PHP67529.1 hypothetical protein CSC94_07430 [Zhengella mangrovi]